MAQKRGIEYNVALTSFQVDELDQGLLPAGRYYGYDTMTNAGGVGVNISLNHTNGFLGAKHSPAAFDSTPSAYVVTPQGVRILTDEILQSINIPDMQTVDERRTDLIVMNHEYVNVAGGQTATISLIQGTPQQGNAKTTIYADDPALPNPVKQIIIGRIRVRSTAVALTYNDIKWEPALKPNQAAKPLFSNDEPIVLSNYVGKKAIDLTTANMVNNMLILTEPCQVINLYVSGSVQLDQIDREDAQNNLIPYGTELEINVTNQHSSIRLNTQSGAVGPLWITGLPLRYINGPASQPAAGSVQSPTYLNVTNQFKVRLTTSGWIVTDVKSNHDAMLSDYASGWWTSTTQMQVDPGQGISIIPNECDFQWKTFFHNSPNYFGAALNMERYTSGVKISLVFDIQSGAQPTQVTIDNLPFNLPTEARAINTFVTNGILMRRDDPTINVPVQITFPQGTNTFKFNLYDYAIMPSSTEYRLVWDGVIPTVELP